MTLLNCYVTFDEIEERLGGNVPAEQKAGLESAIYSACRAIDTHCAQFFYDTVTPSARSYRPADEYSLQVDPFSTTAGLVIASDTAADGTYATTWAAADYELVPFTGGDYSTAVPFDTIWAVGSSSFLTTNRRGASVRITARWGWTTPPQNVIEAARILSVDFWKRKDTPFGIATGTIEFGALRIGRDVMAGVASLLQPFVRVDRVIGIA